ncbi:MAG TPA: transposase, partial [Pirellulales bacterium]|nr:transposase [Pirellulales bacterium]
MQDASTIAAANPVDLERELERLRCFNAELLATIAKQKSQIEQLEGRLDWLVRQHFGRRSERSNPDQLPLFADPEGEQALPPPSPTPPEKEFTPKNPRKGHGRRKAAKELPRET